MIHPALAALLLTAASLTLSTSATADLAAAQRLADAGRTQAALSEVERHLNAHPTDPGGRFLRAHLLTRIGRDEEALTLYRQLAAELPRNPEPHNNLAAIFAARGEVEQARQSLLAALATHPSYAAAFDNLQALHGRLASIAYRRALGNGEGKAKQPLELTALSGIHQLAPTRPVVVATAPATHPTTAPKPHASTQPTPTAPPAAAKPSPKDPATDPAQTVLKLVKGWAAAWSAQDVTRYLAHYSDDYRPDGMSHRQWRAQRERRLTKPRAIRVTLKRLSVRVIAADTVHAVFEQSYRADTYHDRVRKRLTLKRLGDGWKIVTEQTLEVLS